MADLSSIDLERLSRLNDRKGRLCYQGIDYHYNIGFKDAGDRTFILETLKALERHLTEQQKTAEPCGDVQAALDWLYEKATAGCTEFTDQLPDNYNTVFMALKQPAAPAQIDAVDKWEPLKISNGYQYPAQSGEYIVRMIDGAELRSQYDGRFFRRKDNCDKIIPAHEIVCFKAIRAALTQTRETVSTTMDYNLIAPVAHYFNGDADKTKAWFETPNPNLGGVKPIDTPRDRLLKFITEQTSPQPPVDVEALKRDVRKACPKGFVVTQGEVIDYLVSKGYLK